MKTQRFFGRPKIEGGFIAGEKPPIRPLQKSKNAGGHPMDKLDTFNGLEELKRKGVISELGVDHDRILLKWPVERGERDPFMAPTRISWEQAEVLVRKPAQREDDVRTAKEAAR